MSVAGSVRTAVLLAFLVSTARAQPAMLSYVGEDPCCIAVDGQGNNFVVSSSALLSRPSAPLAIFVTKLDPSGKVLSNFALEIGTGDVPTAAAVDPAGNLWIVGGTPPPPPPPPGSNIPFGPPAVGLIVKLDNTGANVLFTDTFGGVDPNGATIINAIAFDPSGNLYMAGSTSQLDFPVTPGAFTKQIPTVPPPPGSTVPGRPQYSFIAKLAPAPNQTTPPYTVAYSTLLGGQQLPVPVSCSGCVVSPPATTAAALAVDANGIVTVAGATDASDFPVTQGAFQTQFQGGDNTADLFVTRLNAQGAGLSWSTFLGEGISEPSVVMVAGIGLDSSGNVVVTGITQDPNYPVTPGAVQPQFAGSQDGFVVKLNSTGTGLLFSTFYGSSTYATPPKLRLDAQSDIWITEPAPDLSGLVLHPNSLVLGGALIAELSADGSSVLFSELLPDGVAGQDLVLNPDGSLTAIGPPQGEAFSAPVTTGFALRLPRATPTGVSILGVADSSVNAVTNTVAPGEYVSIYGTGLGPAAGVGMQIDGNGVVSSSLGGTQVSIGGVLAPLIYASESQINMLVPYETAATIPLTGSGQVNMTITSAAGTSQTLALQVVQTQPNIFVILNSDGSVNSASNPAAVGETVSVLVSGAGALNPGLPDGTIAGSPAPVPVLPVQADFSFEIFEGFGAGEGLDTVTPSYAGSIPGMVINMLRVNAQAPNLSMMGPPPFGAAVAVGGLTSPEVPFFVASPAN
jgi:uncharacterized protein (TIGR03437 family)